MIEFLYSSEVKQYTAELVNPKLQILLVYLNSVIYLIKSENIDTVFIQEVFGLAAQALTAFAGAETLFRVFQDRWLYKLIRVGVKLPGCMLKLNKVLLAILHMLRLMCDHRESQQILLFMKIFKDYEEHNDIAHINFESRKFDMSFKNIFTIH